MIQVNRSRITVIIVDKSQTIGSSPCRLTSLQDPVAVVILVGHALLASYLRSEEREPRG